MHTSSDNNEPVDRNKALSLTKQAAEVVDTICKAVSKEGVLRILGNWPDESDLPDDTNLCPGNAWIWRGCIFVLNHDRKWLDVGPPTVVNGVQIASTEFPLMEDRKILPYRVIGSWPDQDDLPLAEAYPKDDALVHRHRVFVNDGQGAWIDTDPVSVLYDTRQVPLNEAELQENPPVTSEEAHEGRSKARQPSINDKHPMGDRFDVGSMARELLERKAEVKRLKRKRIIDRCIFWLVILSGVGVLGYFAYGLALANYETGRYSDERQCKVVTDNLTITGKRTYSYPYKSLFGFRLVDESKVSEQTVINVTGDKMSIIGLTGKRWWGYRISQGERGIQILKPADTYTISTDKGLAVVTYKGFCQAVGKQSEEPNPKAVDQAIID